MRKINKAYLDPVELIWMHAASEMGMTIQRSSEVNASWDGHGVLTIGTPETLDPDDCLAQMILHEACHALCEGPAALQQPDWGLDSFNPAKKIHEHACLRLQAALADRHGMRSFFASTTVFRKWYDRLPSDPLAESDDPSVRMARTAYHRAFEGTWGEILDDAIRRTAAIAAIVQDVADSTSLWRSSPTDKVMNSESQHHA